MSAVTSVAHATLHPGTRLHPGPCRRSDLRRAAARARPGGPDARVPRTRRSAQSARACRANPIPYSVRGARLREQALQPLDRVLGRLLQQPERALQVEALVHAPHKVPKHHARRVHLRPTTASRAPCPPATICAHPSARAHRGVRRCPRRVPSAAHNCACIPKRGKKTQYSRVSSCLQQAPVIPCQRTDPSSAPSGRAAGARPRLRGLQARHLDHGVGERDAGRAHDRAHMLLHQVQRLPPPRARALRQSGADAGGCASVARPARCERMPARRRLLGSVRPAPLCASPSGTPLHSSRAEARHGARSGSALSRQHTSLVPCACTSERCLRNGRAHPFLRAACLV